MNAKTVVVGEGQIAVKCLDLLKDSRFVVTHVVSECPRVIERARKDQIAVCASYDDMVEFLGSVEIDFLFSVVFLHKLPDEILGRVKNKAFNYHDAILPRFSGLNTPNWAILSGTRDYGISWHEMTSEIDGGDLYVEKPIIIDPKETSLSLNVKCATVAVEGFQELLEQITDNRFIPKSQEGERKLYLRHHRPEHHGFITPNDEAEGIDRLVRALDHGPYPNLLCVPKLKIKEEVLYLKNSRVELADSVPGRVLSVSPFRLGLQGGILEVHDIFDCELKAKLDELGISQGDDLSAVCALPSEDVITRLNQSAKAEFAYRRQFRSFPEPEVPFPSSEMADSGRANVGDIPVVDDAATLAAKLALFVSRFTGAPESNLPLLKDAGELSKLFPSSWLWSYSVEENESSKEVLERLASSFKKLVKWPLPSRDFFHRFPELGPKISRPYFSISLGSSTSSNAVFDIALHQGQLRVTSLKGVDEGLSSFVLKTLSRFLSEIRDNLTQKPADISVIKPEDIQSIFNPPIGGFPSQDINLYQQFVDQATRSAGNEAMVYQKQSVTYQQLSKKIDQFAGFLVKKGAKQGDLVGVHLERSIDSVACLFAILKIGSAWVPLDPDFPLTRLEYIAEDANLQLILTSKVENRFGASDQRVVYLDESSEADVDSVVSPEIEASDKAYVIYTSGSTGNPKGVVLEHRHAANFFHGMDQRIPANDYPKTWLALTTLSFDISILELVWTLTRGFKVVIGKQSAAALSPGMEGAIKPDKSPEFSFFYFGATNGIDENEKYKLMLEGAKYADANGFHAVWTPERHFGEFGGHFPNPAVTGAAIASVTKNIEIRAGSCVAALHSPYRVAEEWSVVDNLSGGRCGIAIAAGWQPNDFVIKPENWQDRKDRMFQTAEVVQNLWQGKTVTDTSPSGREFNVTTYPRPLSKKLPVWVTTAGNPETFIEAGKRGYRVLTHLIGQDTKELSEKINLYRKAYREAGHPEGGDWVTLMLHTFVGENEEEVKELVRGPMKAYLKTAISLVKAAAWSFPTFDKKREISGQSIEEILKQGLDEETEDALLDHAFERYYAGSALLGTKESLQGMMATILELQVDEIGCLLDFGVDPNTVIENLPNLKNFVRGDALQDESLLDLVEDHNIQFMQSTPTFAQMMMLSEVGEKVIEKVPNYLVGGEALPDKLAQDILKKSGGRLMNMYGPTETTIWSTCGEIKSDSGKVNLGSPISNTYLYVLDDQHNLVAPGCAGELYIGGASVARGYLDRPELNRERFVENPFNCEGSPRIYKTGDLVRYWPDGRLEYIGRNDFQVKIRGHRIELGEIEAKLETVDGIEQAVVVASRGEGDQRLLAFLKLGNGVELDEVKIKAVLGEKMPAYAVPSNFTAIDEFPRTPNQKIDRNAILNLDVGVKSPMQQEAKTPPLPVEKSEPATEETKVPQAVNYSEDELSQKISNLILPLWKAALGLDDVPANRNFFDLGGHSLLAVALHKQMTDALGCKFPLVDFFSHSSMTGLSEHLASKFPQLSSVAAISQPEAESTPKEPAGVEKPVVMEISENIDDDSIAVVGMAARLPGAATIQEFWDAVYSGKDCTRQLTDHELRAAGVSEDLIRNPDYVKRVASLDNPEYFDAGFFGLSPREAALMDPQHRQFLEVSWLGLEDAGCDPQSFEGKIGVFGSSSIHKYMMDHLNNNEDVMENDGFFLVRHTGNDKDFLTTRVSYTLGLTGPSIAIQTACSSSLVAVHTAAQSIKQGECDMAIAGGTSLELPLGQGYLHERGSVASPDGKCRAFSDDSAGTYFGSGTGVVILKRLSKAIEDKDQIYCVIKGSATSNDGNRKVGYLAPSSDGQAQAASDAIKDSGISSDSIGYLEAHGTGTKIGDPIEITGLTQGFRDHGDGKGFCAVGSVKPNIGHLDTAAGIASFIKAGLVVKHGLIPPLVHFGNPNELIDWDDSPFNVSANSRPWPVSGPKRASVNSTGVGGTNAHVVIEEPPVQMKASTKSPAPFTCLFLSAKNMNSLKGTAKNYADWISSQPEESLNDIAGNLAYYRRRFSQSVAVLGKSKEDLIEQLNALGQSKKTVFGTSGDLARKVVFMFPGGGSQYANMARGLYHEIPAFRDELDRLFKISLDVTGRDFRQMILPEPGLEAQADSMMKSNPACAMVATVMVEYALAKLLIDYGVEPWAMTGHSLGEYAAAALAGVFSVNDAFKLLWARGCLSQKVPSGSMVSVSLSRDELAPYLVDGLEVSVENTPNLSVISGPKEKVDQFAQLFEDRDDVAVRKISIDIAAHSSQLDPVLEEFRAICQTIKYAMPQRRFISNGTGGWADKSAATPDYWVRHFRNTVKFSDGVSLLAQKEEAFFLEVGPGTALSSLVKSHSDFKSHHGQCNTLRHPREKDHDVDTFYQALCSVWAHGGKLDLSKLFGSEKPWKMQLPGYSFDQKPYMIPKPRLTVASGATSHVPVAPSLSDSSFYRTQLKEVKADDVTDLGQNKWLIFGNVIKRHEGLLKMLKDADAPYIFVEAGAKFEMVSEQRLRASFESESLETLFQHLENIGFCPDRVVHAHCLEYQDLTSVFDNGVMGILNVVKAMEKTFEDQKYVLEVLTGTNAEGGPEGPTQSLLDSTSKVLPKEFSGLNCGVIEVADGSYKPQTAAFWQGRTWVKLTSEGILESELVQDFTSPQETKIRVGGTFLITGGLGGIGLSVAEELVDQYDANVVLLSRRNISDTQIDSLIKDSSFSFSDRRILEKFGRLNRQRLRVKFVTADVSDYSSLSSAVNATIEQFGAIHGVIHGAGVLDDGPAMMKERSGIERVLMPKVWGTLNLERAVQDQPLDFFVVFSSSSVESAPEGQYDYVAANAFLKAFAEARSSSPMSRRHAQTRFLSLGWGMWQGTGMAYRSSRFRGQDYSKSVAIDHPMLKRCLFESKRQTVFEAEFERDKDWFIGEHRVKDSYALMPGTGYIEMARAAVSWVLREDSPKLEIKDVYFLAPLVVPGGKVVKAQIEVTFQSNEYQVKVVEVALSGALKVVATMTVSIAAGLGPVTVDPRQLVAKLTETIEVPDPACQIKQEMKLDFGPRWKSLKTIFRGNQHVLARVELAREFANDLGTFKIHPAMMDLGTGLPIELFSHFDSESLYVPATYRKVIFYRPFEAKMWAHGFTVCFDKAADTLTVNICYYNNDGQVVLAVDGLVLKKIDQNRNLFADAGDGNEVKNPLDEGIRSEEGVKAFSQAVSSSHDSNHWYVSSSNLFLAHVGHSSMGRSSFDDDDDGQESVVPVLNSELERQIFTFFKDTLGIENPNPEESFFDLGGHSLVAIKLLAKVRKEFGIELDISIFFEAPSIRLLAAFLEAKGIGVEGDAASSAKIEQVELRDPKEFRSLVEINAGSSIKRFFCIHGAGGNVLNFYPLSKAIGDSYSFYGLQARGIDGKIPLSSSVEEMAEQYLSEILEVQPEGPYLVGGFSGGGTVALEVANRLVAMNKKVEKVVLVDTPCQDGHESKKVSLGDVYRSEGLKYILQYPWSATASKLRKRRYESFHSKGLRAPDELRETEIFWEFSKAAGRYKVKPYSGDVILFKASKTYPKFDLLGPDLGWSKYLPNLEIFSFPGDHLSLMREPGILMAGAVLRGVYDDQKLPTSFS